MKSTCQKWSRIVEEKGPEFLPRMDIDTWQLIGKSCNGKIFLGTRKLISTLASQLSNFIAKKI